MFHVNCLHKLPSIIFSEKKKKNRMVSASVLLRTLRVKRVRECLCVIRT